MKMMVGYFKGDRHLIHSLFSLAKAVIRYIIKMRKLREEVNRMEIFSVPIAEPLLGALPL